ncbi:hypothetical protein ACWEIK_17855 [Streptomyces sp. NPDC004673]
MALLQLAAEGKSGFWPTGAIMLVVITVISGSIGIWRTSRIKRGKRT